MSAVFNKKPDDSVKAARALKEEKEALEKKVGQLTMEMEWLKKNNNRSQKWGKKSLIDFESPQFTIRRQCELLDLARATAYYKQVQIKPSQEEVNIKNAIDLIHYKEPAYGVRRIRDELRKLGFTKVGKRLIRRYMHEMGIVAFYPGPNLSKRDQKAKVHPYLLRHMKIERPNQVWSIDITYIGMPTGFVYMTAIIDWYSRFIVGWSISNTLHSEHVVQVVKAAIEAHGKPDIINSDYAEENTMPKILLSHS